MDSLLNLCSVLPWDLPQLLTDVSCLVSPAHVTLQESHAVLTNPIWGSLPKIWRALATCDEKLPSTTVLACILTVSVQVSDCGVSDIIPFQKGTINGVTLTDLVANSCLNHSTSA